MSKNNEKVIIRFRPNTMFSYGGDKYVSKKEFYGPFEEISVNESLINIKNDVGAFSYHLDCIVGIEHFIEEVVIEKSTNDSSDEDPTHVEE
jgi:hypothetical protein